MPRSPQEPSPTKDSKESGEPEERPAKANKEEGARSDPENREEAPTSSPEHSPIRRLPSNDGGNEEVPLGEIGNESDEASSKASPAEGSASIEDGQSSSSICVARKNCSEAGRSGSAQPAGDDGDGEDGGSGDKSVMPWRMKPTKMGKKMVNMMFRTPKTKKTVAAGDGVMLTSSGLGEPSIYHALVVIFLEFFAWGLLTSPMITVLNQTFPDHTFLMNGLIQGIKGLLSFLSAPLIGALSDIWGRKFFLLITVFFTCAPIPLMWLNTWWYFAMISISGVFAVTFSVVFAYVADVTNEADRSSAYGLVSATFAASLVTSPALGAYLEQVFSEEVVIMVATAIAILDVFFIMVAVPESLPDKCRPQSRGLTLEQVDPFAALRKAWKDKTILMLCITVFLSYLPEAGQYSCFFVYLRLVMGFSKEGVAMFIAAVGILSVIAQTGLLTMLMRVVGSKHTIMVGLVFEMLQLMWYGFGSQTWMMWAAGVLAAVSSITYPAISAFVSMHAEADQQGLVQGMITGMRGLCNGLGPAMFGLIFNLFNVNIMEKAEDDGAGGGGGDQHTTARPGAASNSSAIGGGIMSEEDAGLVTQVVPGPPFVFGALLVILALMVSAFIPESLQMSLNRESGPGKVSPGVGSASLASADGIGIAPATAHSRRSSGGAAGGGGGGSRRMYASVERASSGGGVVVESSLMSGASAAKASSRHHYRTRSDDSESSDREYTVPLIHTQHHGGLNSSGDSSAL